MSIVDEYEFNLARALLYPDLDVFGQLDGNNEMPGPWIGLTAYKATKVRSHESGPDPDLVMSFLHRICHIEDFYRVCLSG